MPENHTVVCLVDRRRNALTRALRRAGFTVVESFTTDQVVAICVNNQIDAVLLDQEFFVEVDGWSVGQSLKLIKANLCVVLASRATHLTSVPPRGVDVVVSHFDLPRVVATVSDLLDNQKRSSREDRVLRGSHAN